MPPIRRRLREQIIKFSTNLQPFEFGMSSHPIQDAFVYTSVIAEWDPLLAARIIDADIQIKLELRRRYQVGAGQGHHCTCIEG